jgi:hypothetical protein
LPGSVEQPQQTPQQGGAGAANHESPRTMKRYDRTHDAIGNDGIGLDEIERILI